MSKRFFGDIKKRIEAGVIKLKAEENESIIKNIKAQKAIEDAEKANQESIKADAILDQRKREEAELERQAKKEEEDTKKNQELDEEIARNRKEIEELKKQKKEFKGKNGSQSSHKSNIKNQKDREIQERKARIEEAKKEKSKLSSKNGVNPETKQKLESAKKATESARKHAMKASTNAMKATKEAKKAAKLAGKVASKALKAAPIWHIIAIVAIVIVVLIALIGMLFFFIAMPGMVRGKIEEWINTITSDVYGFFNGKEQAAIMITRENLVEKANYLESMGYDLKGMGFVSEELDDRVWSAEVDGDSIYPTMETNNPENLVRSDNLKYKNIQDCPVSEREIEEGTEEKKYHNLYMKKGSDISENEAKCKENIMMTRDENGDIAFIKSKYLVEYIMSDNASYLIRNANVDAWQRFLKNFGAEETSDGSGMIYFPKNQDKNIVDYVKGAEGKDFIAFEDTNTFKDRVKISRPARLMRIDSMYMNSSINMWYDYSLDGWVTKYGIPWQLCMAIHTSSLSPDFAEKFAKRGYLDDTVEMGLVPTQGNSVDMILNIDTDGDGQKEIVELKKELKMLKHKKTDGSDEHYTSVNEILSQIEVTEEEKQKIKEQQITLEKFEEDLKKVTNNGLNRINVGSIGAVYHNVQQTPTTVEISPDMIDDNNIYINIEIDNEYFNNLVALMCEEGILYKDEREGRLKRNTEADSTRYNKAKEIFYKYFKMNSFNKVKDEMSRKTDSPFKNVKWENFNNVLEENDEAKEPEKYFKEVHRKCGEGPAGREGMKVVYEDQVFVGTTKLLWDWYVTGDVMYFGEQKGIDKVKEMIADIIPFRFHYKIVDLNGNAITYNNEKNPDLPPEEFLGHGKTYFPDPENTGYFYPGKIPKKIVSMIVNKEEENLTDADGVKAKIILDKVNSIHYEDIVKLVPIILEVKNHWYRDLSFKNCYKIDKNTVIDEIHNYEPASDDPDEIKVAAANDILKLSEKGTEKITQIREPVELKKGDWLRSILTQKYYIYDGIHRSETKKNIDFTRKVVTSDGEEHTKLSSINDTIIATLEQIEGEDAQYIIRMFKEFLATQGIEFLETEMTGDKIELFKRVIRDYGNKDMLYTTDGSDMVYRAQKESNPKGFEKNLVVQAPATGKIVYRNETAIGIEINDESEKLNKYTIIIAGFKVNESIQWGQTVTKNSEIGRTTQDDISMALRDEDLNIVVNKTIKTESSEEAGNIDVNSPVDGKIINVTESSITIDANAMVNTNIGKVIISNFKVNSTIGIGSKVVIGSNLGKAKKDELKVEVYDRSGNIIKLPATN